MMLLFFLVSCFFMQEAFGSNSGACNGTRKYVCGQDGNTYISQCIMSLAGVQRDHTGPCTVGDCIKRCPTTEGQEICASDLKTYDNECTMSCTNSNLTKLIDGRCPCFCQYIYKPVCGNDDITYSNECELNCTRTVTKKSDGECPLPKLCPCPFIYDPICGQDGVTYANQCLLDCNNVQRKNKGECKSRR